VTGEPRIYRSLAEAEGVFAPAALTVGNFDGVHTGHRRIFRRVAAVAREHGWKPSALTFDPHPTRIVAPGRVPPRLTTLDERCRLMAAEGIKQALVLPFDRKFSRLSPEEFVRDVLAAKLGVRAVLVGEGFRFGYRQSGGAEDLAVLGRRYGFLLEVIPKVAVRGRAVSSSEIRRLVERGQVSLAARLLERPHSLEGEVVRGRGVGSKLIVPTLNLAPPEVVLPAAGVYITRTTDLDGAAVWPSVTNVGRRPTFGEQGLAIETHLLADLGGCSPRRIRIEFLRRLRDERPFPDPASLKAQIERDAARARRFFRLVDRLVYSRGNPVQSVS